MAQTIEGVAWDTLVVNDQLRYGRLKGLMKKLLPIGLRQGRVRHNSSTLGGHKRINFNFIPRNARFINPYTFLGLMVRTKQVVATASHNREVHQFADIGLTTVDADLLHFSWSVKFDERNPDFHMAKV